MEVGSAPELEGIVDARSADAWLRGLSAEPGARLDAIRALLVRLTERSCAVTRAGPQVLTEVLETLRVEQWRAIVARLEPLAGRPVPFTPIEWPLLQSALGSLHALRNLYKRVHAQNARAGDEVTEISGARESLAAVLPLMRALDAQSRIVSLQLRYRCVPQAAEWDELCVLARNARRTSFQDEEIADAVPLVKPATPRALFVYPLLLECASLSARFGAEADLAQRLAARLAARVGYRIDRGAPRDNEYGPRMALTAVHAVRLDTHRVPDSLAKWRSQWLREDGEPRGALALPLPEADAMRLFDDLESCWSAAATPRISGAHPAASAASQPVRLRFGLPKTYAADRRPLGAAGAAPVARHDQNAGDVATGATRSGEARYEYGRWEQNTIIRLAFGGAHAGAASAPNWIGESESATRLLERPDGRTVIARESAVPRATPGALIALEHDAPIDGDRRSAAPARSIALGTIEAIEQLPARESHASRAHWLVARLWVGEAIAVGVRVGDSAFFEDAWLLRGLGASSELPCVVMTPGRARGGDPGVLREPGGEVAIRFVSVLDRGSGHERLSIRTESGRDAHR